MTLLADLVGAAGVEQARGVRTAALAHLAGNYRECGLTDVTVKKYPGGRHEMFNETNRDEVIAELLSWLGGKLP